MVGSVGSVGHSDFTRGEFIRQIFRARVADDCSVDVELFSFFIFNAVVEERCACCLYAIVNLALAKATRMEFFVEVDVHGLFGGGIMFVRVVFRLVAELGTRFNEERVYSLS